MQSYDECGDILRKTELSKEIEKAKEEIMDELLKPEVREVHITKKPPFLNIKKDGLYK